MYSHDKICQLSLLLCIAIILCSEWFCCKAYPCKNYAPCINYYGANKATQFSPLYSCCAHVSYSHDAFSSATFNPKLQITVCKHSNDTIYKLFRFNRLYPSFYINGNICLCTGCMKSTQNHLNHLMTVVQHEEWWSYVAGGLKASKFGNAYYHSSLPCTRAKCWPLARTGWNYSAAN